MTFAKEPPPSAELEASLKLAVDAELSLPARPWWKDAVAFVVVACALAGLGFAVMSRTPAPELRALVPALALFVAGLTAGVAALAPWPQRTARPLAFGGLVVGLAVLTEVLSMQLLPPSLHLGCAAFELLASVAPAAVALAAARHHAPKPSRALVLGWAAGAVSLSVVQLTCAHHDVGHALLAHVAPMLAVGAVAVVARRALVTRSYAP